MKKAVFGIGLLLLGLLLGFLIGQSVNVPIIKKIISKPVVDTIIKPKYVEVPVEVKTVITKIDTVFVAEDSTGQVIVVDRDSMFLTEADLESEDVVVDADTLNIKRDKKLSTEVVFINYLTKEVIDTLLTKLLDVAIVQKEKILIEYWQSPINYKGYKLSKSKLIVFGLMPVKPIKFYKDEQTYYFYNNKEYYRLLESNDFRDLSKIPKPSKIDD